MIILSGFAIGVLQFFEFLPKTVTILDLGENIKFVYIGIIVFSGYLFHKNYYGKEPPVPSFARSVPTRDLSSKSQKRMFAKFKRQPNVPYPQSAAPVHTGGSPSRDIFKEFKKDDK